MDKRCRPAKKRYRNSDNGVVFITTSLILTKALVNGIEKKLEESPEYDSNMSKFIEDNVNLASIEKIGGRRAYSKKGATTKKTCTFTENFVKELKKSGNMSLTVEKILSKVLNL